MMLQAIFNIFLLTENIIFTTLGYSSLGVHNLFAITGRTITCIALKYGRQ